MAGDTADRLVPPVHDAPSTARGVHLLGLALAWFALSGMVITAYYSLRIAHQPISADGRFVQRLGVDLLLFLLLGGWLFIEAKQWCAQRLSLWRIGLRLLVRAMAVTLVMLVLMALLMAARGGGEAGWRGLADALAGYATSGLLFDHFFFWMVASTAVPLPWIIAVREGKRADKLSRIIIRNAGRMVVIAVEDVDFACAADNYIEIHCGSKVHMARMTLEAFASDYAAAGLLRIARGVVINIAKIATLERNAGRAWRIALKGGDGFTVSRPYRKALIERLEGHWPQ